MKILISTVLLLLFLSHLLGLCQSVMPHKGDNISKIKHWDNCDGIHTFDNGNKYVGGLNMDYLIIRNFFY